MPVCVESSSEDCCGGRSGCWALAPRVTSASRGQRPWATRLRNACVPRPMPRGGSCAAKAA
eukprot:6982442-Prymnesium_polylepis.1